MKSLSNNYLFSCPEVMEYKSLMNKLIHEGKEARVIEQKIETAKELSKSLFSIEGSVEFTQLFNDKVVKLCELKPGRKLIKHLSRSLSSNPLWEKILVREGEESKAKANEIYICIKNKENYYNALIDGSYVLSKRPLMVKIAHELIHTLHDLTMPLFSEKLIKTKLSMQGILKNMHTPEEMDTILGIAPYISDDEIGDRQNRGTDLPKYKELKKSIDVMCENAFLLALNLPPRVDHFGGDPSLPSLDEQWSENQKGKNFDFYYQWLDEVMQIEKETENGCRLAIGSKYDDEEIALKCLAHEKILPGFFKNSVSRRLLTDIEFLIKVRKIISDFSEFCRIILHVGIERKYPAARLELMKRLGQENFGDFVNAAPLLWRNKEYVLFALSYCKDQNSVQLILEKVHPSLKNDSEILLASIIDLQHVG